MNEFVVSVDPYIHLEVGLVLALSESSPIGLERCLSTSRPPASLFVSRSYYLAGFLSVLYGI